MTAGIQWRDRLRNAIAARDHETIESVWMQGVALELWRHLGYEDAESFCVTELGVGLPTLRGWFETVDILPVEPTDGAVNVNEP
jgi:hypothetical protein